MKPFGFSGFSVSEAKPKISLIRFEDDTEQEEAEIKKASAEPEVRSSVSQAHYVGGQLGRFHAESRE
jgi:hypothetical protein